jgi:putative ABC transport system ATP-binding protein
MKQNLFEIRDLMKSYGQGNSRVDVLKNIRLDVRKGEILTVLGPSGSGKSTLLNIIGALDTADSGDVYYKGRSLTGMNKKERIQYRRKEVGFIFQFYNLLGDLNAKENVESCQYLSDRPLETEHLLDVLDLKAHRDKFPRQLSGGQQQRVAVARALVKNPQVLLCDEPTGALDYSMAKEILALLEKINREYQTTLVIVTHNEAIKDMSHHVVKMSDGTIAEDYDNDNLKAAKDISW